MVSRSSWWFLAALLTGCGQVPAPVSAPELMQVGLSVEWPSSLCATPEGTVHSVELFFQGKSLGTRTDTTELQARLPEGRQEVIVRDSLLGTWRQLIPVGGDYPRQIKLISPGLMTIEKASAEVTKIRDAGGGADRSLRVTLKDQWQREIHSKDLAELTLVVMSGSAMVSIDGPGAWSDVHQGFVIPIAAANAVEVEPGTNVTVRVDAATHEGIIIMSESDVVIGHNPAQDG